MYIDFALMLLTSTIKVFSYYILLVTKLYINVLGQKEIERFVEKNETTFLIGFDYHVKLRKVRTRLINERRDKQAKLQERKKRYTY